MRRYPSYQQMMEPGAGRNPFASAEGTIPEEATHYNVTPAASSQQQVAHSFTAAGSSLLNLSANSKRKQVQMEYSNNESSRPAISSEELVHAEDEMRADGRKPRMRKKVSEMNPDERLKWSRIQSRDHSRRSRQRRKKIEEVNIMPSSKNFHLKDD